MGLKYEGLLLDLDALFGSCEKGASPQRLYESCDLGAIAEMLFVDQIF